MAGHGETRAVYSGEGSAFTSANSAAWLSKSRHGAKRQVNRLNGRVIVDDMTDFTEMILDTLTDRAKTSKQISDETGLEVVQVVRVMSNAVKNGKCVSKDVDNPAWEKGSGLRKTVCAYTKAAHGATKKEKRKSPVKVIRKAVILPEGYEVFESMQQAQNAAAARMALGQIVGKISLAEITNTGEMAINWKRG